MQVEDEALGGQQENIMLELQRERTARQRAAMQAAEEQARAKASAPSQGAQGQQGAAGAAAGADARPSGSAVVSWRWSFCMAQGIQARLWLTTWKLEVVS